MPALFFALGRWDGNIGRESAALIESSLLSAALVPGRALHLMGGDAHDDRVENVGVRVTP